MPRGRSLSAEERGKFLAFHEAKWSQSRIVKELKRSQAAVKNFLRNPEAYGSKKRAGRPRKLTVASRRMLLREASKGILGSRELYQDLQLPVQARRVRQILNQHPTLTYKKIKRVPQMLIHHKTARVAWATEKVTWTIPDWNNVVWSDEKKFNLDGPDGFACCWHDLRREDLIFSKRQQGGGSLMVWGAFAGGKKCELAILEGKQTAVKYIGTLESFLLPFADQELGPSWVFQQDGALIHCAHIVREWFNEEDMVVLDWPAKSPDLNPIENLWGIRARKVYEHRRQFWRG
ncbi:unnamed protein product [Chondrus crispus]|uniref:Tc3 transposase DNA binding domain-containing protein n=1 Tax=Chondrus crispus TaxID=2769 RepID=R7QP07_CHOCR|nr:unnamed protein product [Chondrus crispus]CDF39120.1 unnamed protein product [Chondrus crispus]|eukprot:XP_005719031.1 unnamed protein product [Chondrus crispus]